MAAFWWPGPPCCRQRMSGKEPLFGIPRAGVSGGLDRASFPYCSEVDVVMLPAWARPAPPSHHPRPPPPPSHYTRRWRCAGLVHGGQSGQDWRRCHCAGPRRCGGASSGGSRCRGALRRPHRQGPGEGAGPPIRPTLLCAPYPLHHFPPPPPTPSPAHGITHCLCGPVHCLCSCGPATQRPSLAT
jgi:hypothetical protein